MQLSFRKMGNSTGLIFPKPLLALMNVKADDAVEASFHNGEVTLRPVDRDPRAGWAEASKAIAAAGDGGLIWPEFGNDGDDELEW